jgi:Protein of unknown function (DUF1643)
MHQRELDDWTIHWETDGEYRHWCAQTRPGDFNGRFIAVCLFNPGSLNGDGKQLRSDTTLRILRDVFSATPYGCLVVNLFDRATPDPAQLFSLWSERDKLGSQLIYDFLSPSVAGSIRAYGDFANHPDRVKATDIQSRVAALELWRARFPCIDSPTNDDGTPMHVMRWQIRRLKATMVERLSNFAP